MLSTLVWRKKGQKVKVGYLYLFTKVILEEAICKSKNKRYIFFPGKGPFLYPFQVMAFTSQLFFPEKCLCYYPWLLFSDDNSAVGHYQKAGLVLEHAIKCCGGMVISTKMLKERRNINIQKIVPRKSN